MNVHASLWGKIMSEWFCDYVVPEKAEGYGTLYASFDIEDVTICFYHAEEQSTIFVHCERAGFAAGAQALDFVLKDYSPEAKAKFHVVYCIGMGAVA